MKVHLLFLVTTVVWFCCLAGTAGSLSLLVARFAKRRFSQPFLQWTVMIGYMFLVVVLYGYGVTRIQSQWESFHSLSLSAIFLLATAPFAIAALAVVWLFRSLRFGW